MKVSLLALSAFAALPSVTGENLPTCTLMTEETVPKYHTDAVCDRAGQNGDAKRALRASRHQDLKNQGGVAHIPNQKTVVCPTEPMHLERFHGHDTKWIVENKASTPVVLAYVKDGVEYSAMDPSITPPQNDPKAYLQPGKWEAINTFEGHVFYAREVRKDGTLGNILLQHRPGLIGFTNRYDKELDCDMVPSAVEDPEPVIEKVVPPPPTQREQPPRRVIERDPNYKRSPAHRLERCNIVYQGFRNMIPNCPLNVYYAGMQEPSDGPMTCQEKFKFHLGLKEHDLDDYMFSWESRTRFESTMIGHTFTARLANDPSVVVDHFTLQPTQIHDCPGLKQKPIAQMVETVVNPVGVMNGLMLGDNTTLFMEESTNQTDYVWSNVGSSAM